MNRYPPPPPPHAPLGGPPYYVVRCRCFGICVMHTLRNKHSVQKKNQLNFLINTTVSAHRKSLCDCYPAIWLIDTERDIRQTEHFSPILRANRPYLRCYSETSHEHNVLHKLSHALRNGDSLFRSPSFLPYMAVECSDVGSNSFLELFWFDLSTPGYNISN